MAGLRRAYRTQMVLGPGLAPVWVRWYKVADTTPLAPFHHRFGSAYWDSSTAELNTVGEVGRHAKQWANGFAFKGVTTPTQCGVDGYWQGEIPFEAGAYDPYECCGAPTFTIGSAIRFVLTSVSKGAKRVTVGVQNLINFSSDAVEKLRRIIEANPGLDFNPLSEPEPNYNFKSNDSLNMSSNTNLKPLFKLTSGVQIIYNSVTGDTQAYKLKSSPQITFSENSNKTATFKIKSSPNLTFSESTGVVQAFKYNSAIPLNFSNSSLEVQNAVISCTSTALPTVWHTTVAGIGTPCDSKYNNSFTLDHVSGSCNWNAIELLAGHPVIVAFPSGGDLVVQFLGSSGAVVTTYLKVPWNGLLPVVVNFQSSSLACSWPATITITT